MLAVVFSSLHLVSGVAQLQTNNGQITPICLPWTKQDQVVSFGIANIHFLRFSDLALIEFVRRYVENEKGETMRKQRLVCVCVHPLAGSAFGLFVGLFVRVETTKGAHGTYQTLVTICRQLPSSLSLQTKQLLQHQSQDNTPLRNPSYIQKKITMSTFSPCEDKSTTFTGWAYSGSPTLKPYEYYPRPLGPKDIEIEITYDNYCGSDIHVVNGRLGALTLGPVIAGHEIVVKVVAAGSKSGRQVGDIVGAGGQADACGDCDRCNTGHDLMCPKNCNIFHDTFKDGRGGRSQGEFADLVRFNGAYAFKVPANM